MADDYKKGKKKDYFRLGILILFGILFIIILCFDEDVPDDVEIEKLKREKAKKDKKKEKKKRKKEKKRRRAEREARGSEYSDMSGMSSNFTDGTDASQDDYGLCIRTLAKKPYHKNSAIESPKN